MPDNAAPAPREREMTDPAAKTSALSEPEPLSREDVLSRHFAVGGPYDGDGVCCVDAVSWPCDAFILATLDAARTESAARIAALEGALREAHGVIVGAGNGVTTRSRPIEEWQRLDRLIRAALLATTPPTAVEPGQATRETWAALAGDGTVDPHLYALDAVYHAVVYRVYQGHPPLATSSGPDAPPDHEHYWIDAPDDEAAWFCTICRVTEHPFEGVHEGVHEDDVLAASSGPAKEPLDAADLDAAIESLLVAIADLGRYEYEHPATGGIAARLGVVFDLAGGLRAARLRSEPIVSEPVR